MINKVNKGNRHQNSCRKALEAEGWKVYVAVRVKYHEIDIFGCWDLIAYKQGFFRFIQVKSNVVDKESREKIKKFVVPYWVIGSKVIGPISKESWCYKDYIKEPIVEYYK
jgi:hypothetical protein